MKNNLVHSRKFKHGSLSVALTVVIIAAVVIINVIASALAANYSWMYIDMTSEKLYTLSDECIDLLDKSFVEIMQKRAELNEALPLANYEIAKENISVAEKNILIAETAVNTAKKNVELAAINKLAFERSVIKARTNHNIAESNKALAEGFVELAAEAAGRAEGEVVPESSMTAEEKLAAANLKIAEDNLAVATENLRIAAENEKTYKENLEREAFNAQNELKEGDEGYKELLPYTALGEYKAFEDVSEYSVQYGGIAFEVHVKYENEAIAERNLAIANKNLESANKNLEIAKENEAIAKLNSEADVIAGENGYTALREYEKLFDYEAFVTVSNFTEPETFKTVVKTATFNSEKTLYETDVKVKIIFCDLPDNLINNETQLLVYESAKDLAEAFPEHIEVECIDIWNNATAVQKYKSTSHSTINSTNVIIESGTEYRICTLRSFYVFNTTSDTTPWGYRGEETFAASILAVSQAESPIACVTINHSEGIVLDTALLNTLQMAGYKVQAIDLAYQEIPDDCRLVVIYDPKEDFMVKDGVSEISEIEKLDRYLDGLSCAMMVFVNPTTPKLPNLEEYLEEWGVVINRNTDNVGDTYNYNIKESGTASLASDGYTFAGTYVERGVGASVYKTLTESAYPPKVVFKNSTSLSYSELYTEEYYTNLDDPDDETDEYYYGYYSSNGVTRRIYDMFTSSSSAVAMANGTQVKTAGSKPFRLMTMTRESQMVTNDDQDYATVMVCASTEFATESLLSSAVYGNNDVILAAARGMGKEFVPVDLELKPFASSEISEMSTESKNTYTVVLTVIPAALVLGTGVFVLVRRKYS